MNRRSGRLRGFASLSLCALLAACLPAAQGQEPAADATPTQPPEVFLSAQHAALCKVQVGENLPEFALPSAAQPTDDPVPLANQLGSKATVVAFWKGERAMGKSMLRDLALDIAAKYPAKAPEGAPEVAILAVAVETEPGEALALTGKLGYENTVLLDKSGDAYAQLATDRLPRIYVLNAAGEIVWMDIEYSLSTRRELHRSVAALAGEPE